MNSHDNLTTAGSVWNAPTFTPSGEYAEDTSEGLREALSSTASPLPDDILDVFRCEASGKRGDEALSKLSWACRSVQQLPYKLPELLRDLPGITEKMVGSLDQYHQLATDKKGDLQRSPSDFLAANLSDTNKVTAALDCFKSLGAFDLDLLRAANGSDETIALNGAQELEQALRNIGQNESLTSAPMINVGQVSAHAKALAAFEYLVANSRALKTLISATDTLSKIRGPVLANWECKGDAATNDFLPKDTSWLAQDRTALRQGKLHSAVLSYIANCQEVTFAKPILMRASEFMDMEKYSAEPKPSQIINTLHSLCTQARETEPEKKKLEVFGRFCEMIKANPPTPDPANAGPAFSAQPDSEIRVRSYDDLPLASSEEVGPVERSCSEPEDSWELQSSTGSEL